MEMPPKEKGSSPHNLRAVRCSERAGGVAELGEVCPVCQDRERSQELRLNASFLQREFGS